MEEATSTTKARFAYLRSTFSFVLSIGSLAAIHICVSFGYTRSIWGGEFQLLRAVHALATILSLTLAVLGIRREPNAAAGVVAIMVAVFLFVAANAV